MKGKFNGKGITGMLIESSKGTPGVAVELAILNEGAEFSTLTWDGWLTDDAAERTIEALRHLGWKGTDLSNLEGIDANEVELVVDEVIWEGKTQTKVKFINAKGGLSFRTPLAPEKAKSFAEQMKAKIAGFDAMKGNRKSTASNGTPKTSGPVSPEPPPISEKDIQF